MMRIPRLTGVLMIALIACLLAVPAAEVWAGEKVLRVRPFADLKTIDPVVGADYMSRNHGYMVYDTLFGMDEKLAIKPQMVEKYTKSRDGLVWEFTLRPGLKFHDGQPVTSADVVASLQRWGEKDSLGRMLMAHTASLVAVDKTKVKLTLKDAWGLVLEALGKPSSFVPFILPERVAKTPATEVIKDPTGSGPFIMKQDEWVPGSKVVYVRNPNYVPRKEPTSGLAGSRKAEMDRVEFLYMPDAQTALRALQNGEIDIFEEVPPDFAGDIRKNAKLRLVPMDSLGVEAMFRMNLVQPPFSNPKIREAILYMMQQETFLKAFIDDPKFTRTLHSFYIHGSPYYTDAGWPKPDIEKAKQLIKESGYDGTPVVILHATDSASTSAFSSVAAQLMREIGLKVDPQAMDWATLVGRRSSQKPVSEGGWSLFITSPTGVDALDPVQHLALPSNCDKAWAGWPCDEEIEKYRAEFSMTTDMTKRKEIATNLQLRALKYLPYVVIGQFWNFRAHSAALKDIPNAPVQVYYGIKKAD